MNKTRFTPGPWKVHEFNPIAIAVSERTVALAWYAKEMTDEDHANARLIAAAPDLLEALEGLVLFSDDDALYRARAAIAKATEA